MKIARDGRALGVYDKSTAAKLLLFLERVIEEFPFAIQRTKTDLGREFFAHKVQNKLIDYGTKFRLIRPRSPHLNGKVERSQRTDVEELYVTTDLDDPHLPDKLEQWQFYYNWRRPHGSLNGKAPIDKLCELSPKTPLWEDVEASYDRAKERVQEQNCRADLELRKLKRCL